MAKRALQSAKGAVAFLLVLNDSLKSEGMDQRDPEKESEVKQADGPTTDTLTGLPQNDLNNLEEPALSEQKMYIRGFRLVAITIAIMVSVLLVAIDVNIIATAVPRIASTYNSLHDIGWYGAAYSVAVMALQPTYGTIYTQFSLKWTLSAALVIFGIGSIACAVAPSSSALIVSRSIQGMGGAGIMSGGLNIVADLAPQQKRPMFLALIASVYALAGAAGPPIGGLFVDSRLTWRFAFWINLPLVFIACLILLIFYKEPGRNRPERNLKEKLKELQILPSLLLSGAIVCLFFALQRGGVSHPWSSVGVWPFLLAFAAGLAIFTGLQIYEGEKALIPFRVIGQRTVYSCCIYAATLLVSSSTISYYLPYYFQATKGANARQSGVYILPFVITNTFVTFVTAGSITRCGFYVPFMYVGAAILTIGCGLLHTLFTDSPASAWIGFQLIASIGFGLGIQIPFTAVQVKVPLKDRPIANSLLIFSQSFGSALALSIDQNIFNASLNRFLMKIPSVDVAHVISQDPASITTGVPTGQVIPIREAYGKALQAVMIVPIVAAGIAFLGSLATERGNVKVNEHEE
ncbi:putative major facilitator superfamily transporter [Periconia macrospinosa]|uniref:Putative major facilitator superfamily transporter n=1 Tax=Periconia macrospinosa TaxID=97972 RepID=A0A2V1E2L7_9PLEO|nr:putative major facilitator superfamily transporter [Periconia macrospinosa]